MNSILSKFCFDGNPISCEKYGHGHINHTYLVVTDTGRRYILQRLSQVVFKDPADLMSNVAAVTSFLSGKYDDPRRSLHQETVRALPNGKGEEESITNMISSGGNRGLAFCPTALTAATHKNSTRQL